MHFDTPAWKAIDKLVDEQKLEAARTALAELREAAAASGNTADWTRALIRDVQLGSALGGIETAVKTLREAKWPDDEFSQLVLELYYATTLVNYLNVYAYPINQRERVESKGTVDLGAWTRDQIVAEALQSLQRVWAKRAQLSGPASSFGPYVSLNNYPAGVRDTLRDVLSYHVAELLGNTSFWSAAQENELYRAGHDALLAGRAQDVKLDDATLHPIARANAVLVDLAAWHTAAGQRDAALEAELERLRRLHAEFTSEAQRKAQTAALEGLLARTRDVAWWSMGELLLAQWKREAGELVQAHALAQAGAAAHPETPGAIECRRLVAEIEAPEFELSGMALDGPKRRSLSVQHKNLSQLYLRAYKLDLLQRVQKARSYQFLPNGDELESLLKGAPAAEWNVTLPDLKDYASHRTYITPPLAKPGIYAVIVSANPSFALDANRRQAAYFALSRLLLRHRTERDGTVEVDVLDGDTGAPLGDVELSVYEEAYDVSPKRIATKTSDAQGHVKLVPSAPQAWNGRNVFLIARRGEDVTPLLGALPFGKTPAPAVETSSFVFTDRSVYRPNQSVQWKVLAYRGKEASWSNLTQRKLTVSLHDANGDEVQKLAVTTNDYGTAWGTFSIPSGRLLGPWSIRSSLGGEASVRVEEYKRPTFEVSLAPSREPARLNHPVALSGEAKYYFGLPVQSGQLKWKATREERYPWWWCFWRPSPRPAQVVASGTAAVDAKGQFAITFTPEADPQAQAGVQFNYRVSVDLTDEGGETRSTDRSFVVGQASIEARLDLPSGFFLEGQGGAIALRRTNLDGDARPGSGHYRIVALRQPAQSALPADFPVQRDPKDAKPRTPGDELRPRQNPGYDPAAWIATWGDGQEVAGGDIATDAQGNAQITLPKLAGGAYRVRYAAQDDFGQKLEVFRDFVVAGAQTKLALPALLELEQSSVPSGGVLRVLATTGLAEQTLWLEIYSDQKLIERRALQPGAAALQEIPIGPERRGGIALKLVGARDYQALEQERSVFVPWDDRELALEFSTFRDQLRPGQKETFRVSVRGGKERAFVAAAELLGYMYDRSLDVFAPHRPPVPLSLYPARGVASESGWALGESPNLWIRSSEWFTLPKSADLRGDTLEFPSAIYGGIGYGGGMRHRMLELAPMAMPAPSRAAAMAPQASRRVASKAANVEADEVAAEPERKARDQSDSEPPAASPASEVRSNFAETAFFLPHLLTEQDGSAALEFTVPDSVTAWNVWVHAITKDFRSGSAKRETRSVKDLLVRPYLPRFLREVDDVALKVVVQNAGQRPLSGELTFELFDPVTQASLAGEFGLKHAKLPFSVGAHGSTNLTIPIKAPRRVGEVALRVVGKAGDLSDGELRQLPLLPSRLHLVQSKFATLRGDGAQRSLQLQDLLANDDPTRTNDQLVVTVEAQLFMTVLKALPFLIDYPYECSEQTLNRFLSAGIVASVFKKYPAVKQMAAELVKQRTTILDRFDAPDPNRSTQLEESPWLQEARGLPDIDPRLIKVLDPSVASRERDRALSRLQKMQLSNGAFPWFSGGRPSPYMTLYLLIGMARASEFQIALPEDMVQRTWQYLASHYRSDILRDLKAGQASPEFISLLHFAITSFPKQQAFTAAERQDLLHYAFEHWKTLPPLLRSVLSLSLLRESRKADAELVFASVMDSAKTTEDEGTFWQPEERAWLWYNDRIETHAFALRTLLEINERDPKLDGLVVWLLLNKKLNQWKSTRATAEVIYSLVKYLDKKSALGAREVVGVSVGGLPKQDFVFDPAQYKGKAQLRVEGRDVKPEMGKIALQKSGNGVAFASATWHYATDKLPAEGRGDVFSVKRSYFRRDGMGPEAKLVPLADEATLHAGDEIEVQLEIHARAQAEYVHLRDPRAAGLEPPISVSSYHYDQGLAYYEEVRDSANNFFIEWLPAGTYTLKYRLRANLAGHFRVGPATLQSMYAPEFAAFSAGHELRVE